MNLKNIKIPIDYHEIDETEDYSGQIMTEYQQCIDEGLDAKKYKSLFEAAAALPAGETKTRIADALFDLTLSLPQTKDFKYNEPSELEEIKRLSKGYKKADLSSLDKKVLRNRIKGAWIGRICGCLLGKPIECHMTADFVPMLKESGNYPMNRYILSSDITEKYKEEFSNGIWWGDKIKCAPADDDTNYVVLASILIDKYGRDFKSADVLKTWIELQPKNAYCTAERIAYINYSKGYMPPNSARYKNVYREWIGAQIRGDYFGYINPGDPESAAEMGWKDAIISHTKNGIYGEMFAAAMISVSAVCDDIEEIISAGLSQIPQTSRLYESVTEVISWYKNGHSLDECYDEIHKRYNEYKQHDLVHTISNAMIVTLGLLYGEKDFGKSIAAAVQVGFDTDCNGATVGSIIGMVNGADNIDRKWTAPLNGKIETAIIGYDCINIDDIADKAMKHIFDR